MGIAHAASDIHARADIYAHAASDIHARADIYAHVRADIYAHVRADTDTYAYINDNACVQCVAHASAHAYPNTCLSLSGPSPANPR